MKFLKILKYKHTPITLLLVLIILQSLFAFVYAVTLRYELKTSAVDGVSFAQTLFNIINGNGLISTIAPPYIEQSWLGVHFSPILYIITPIYYLFPYIETLLVLHSLLIALAAIPIFYIANIFLKSSWQAFTISIFYLVNPYVFNAQKWDFHEIAFAPLIISLILWAVVAKKRGWLILFCIILLTIKEHYGLAVFGTGLLWAWHWREAKFGLGIAAIGLIAFVIVIKILMPYFSPMGAALMLNENSGVDYFSWLAHPFRDMGFLTGIIVGAIFYCMFLLIILFFQPIFSFVWLFPAIADVAVNVLSTDVMMRNQASYHSAAIIPILLVAYTKTISKNYTNTTKLKLWEMIGATALFAGIFGYGFISLPYFANNASELSNPRLSLSEEDKISHNEVIKIIGETSPISAQFNILPHIPIRRFMYIFPNNYKDADYVILKIARQYKVRYSIFLPKYFNAIDELMNDKNWGIVFYQNNWLVFKRDASNDSVLWDTVDKDLQKLKLEFKENKKNIIATQPSHPR